MLGALQRDSRLPIHSQIFEHGDTTSVGHAIQTNQHHPDLNPAADIEGFGSASFCLGPRSYTWETQGAKGLALFAGNNLLPSQPPSQHPSIRAGADRALSIARGDPADERVNGTVCLICLGSATCARSVVPRPGQTKPCRTGRKEGVPRLQIWRHICMPRQESYELGAQHANAIERQ